MASNTSAMRSGGRLKQPLRLLHQFAHVNWAIADQAVVSGTNFATTILVARYLGIEEFGRFALAWLAIYFSQNLQIALVIQPMMTIGAKQPPADRPAYRGAVIVQQVVLAIVAFLAVSWFLHASEYVFPEWRLAELALPVAALVLAGQGTDFLRRYYFTFSRPALSFAIDCVRYGGQLAVLLALFVAGSGGVEIGTVFYAMAATCVLAFVFGALQLKRIAFAREVFGDVLKRHWRFARWMAPSVFSLWARENLLYVSVGAFVGLAEVGILRAAQQLVMMVNVPLHGLANIVPMRAAKAFEAKGHDGLIDLIDGFVMRYMAAIMTLVVAIAVSGDLVLSLVYGPQYSGAGAIVAAFAMVMIVHLVRNTMGIIVQAVEKTEYEFYASAASIIVLAVSIYPLVQWYGIAGAMLGALLYETAALVAVSFGLQRSGGR